MIPAAGKAKGTVILFHGYTACKSQELDRAEPLIRDGYNCLLVDFMGSGGSAANSTTVGFKEAEEVKDCFEYIKNTGEHNVFLYGSSMGAVAIMKAINDYNIAPDAIIIDCPFGTMYETVAIRFRNLGVPPVPMAAILLFLGGLQNGFWGFSHNPESYAKNVHCPVLLQYGAKDDRVTRGEIDRIYANLGGRKRLVIYPLSGHDDYLVKNGTEWCGHVLGYLSSCPGGSAVR